MYRVKRMVEKPPLEDAPSNLAIVARYVLTSEIFDVLEHTPRGANNEIQLTDAIDALRAEQGAYAYEFTANHFDAGRPIGLLQASIYAAHERGYLTDEIKDWLKDIISD